MSVKSGAVKWTIKVYIIGTYLLPDIASLSFRTVENVE